jgi:ACS family hexuronate transporter-like MFS transporter
LADGAHRRWVVAALLAGASALSFFDRQVLSVLAPSVLADLRMSNVDYGRAVSAFTLAYSLMFALGGRLIDRLGTRAGLGLSVAFWSVASALHALASSGRQLALFRLLLGVGEGGCFPGVARGVLEWFAERQRALAMGIATTGASAVGAVLAPPLIAWLAGHTGWRTAFLTTGLLGALWVVVWFSTYYAPLDPPQEGRSTAEIGKPSAARTPWPLPVLLRLRTVWGLVATRFLLDPVMYIYMFWIPQYLHLERGASLSEIGRLAWIPFMTLGVSSCLGGAASDWLVRRGRRPERARKTVMGMAALLTPVSILALWAPSSLLAVLLLGVLLLAHGFWMTNYMALTADLFPATTVASVVGMAGMAGGIAGFLANLAAGHVVDQAGFTPIFILCGVLYPVGYLIVLLAVHPLPKQ